MKASRVPNLVTIVFEDLRQQLMLMLLFLAVIASALAVVYVSHSHRLLTIERDTLLSERDDIDIEWRHLQIEQNTLTEHIRVERIAQQQLNMVRPEADQEVLVPWQ